MILTIPLCLSAQPLAQPGVIYFTGPDIVLRSEKSLMRARLPGIGLDDGKYNGGD